VIEPTDEKRTCWSATRNVLTRQDAVAPGASRLGSELGAPVLPQ